MVANGIHGALEISVVYTSNSLMLKDSSPRGMAVKHKSGQVDWPEAATIVPGEIAIRLFRQEFHCTRLFQQ